MLRMDAARAQLRRPRPWSWSAARPKTGPDDALEARTADRSGRCPVRGDPGPCGVSLWSSPDATSCVGSATSTSVGPETCFGAVFWRRSAAGGARGSWSMPPDLIDFAAEHIHEATGIQSSGPSDHVWRPPGANVALGARARTRSLAATRRPWGRRCKDMGSELIMSMGEGRGALISAGPDVVSCGVGVARRRRRS